MRRIRILAVITLAALFVRSPIADAQFDALRKITGGSEPAKTIAYFKIKGQLAETPVAMPPLFGEKPPTSLKGLLERFKEARLDDNVVAVVVDFQQAALGMAQLGEVHDSLRQFEAVDKEVYLHADSLTTGTYALATAASHISLVPTGMVWLTGFYGESPYVRGLLDKLGCVPDFERCGDYKTATETIMRTGPSKESEEMTGWLLDDLYRNTVALIAQGRGMTPEKVKKLIDGGPYTAEEALAAGLIDSVQHTEDFVANLKAKYGDGVRFASHYGEKDPFEIPDDNFFAMFDFFMKMMNPEPRVYTKPSVAVVYVDGTIQTGAAERSPFGAGSGAFSTTIRKALDNAADDDSVKAVVLRVDSPGGSALASEIILNAAKRVKAKKPLIVSMGNVAGSGGYYVTCAADMIFASPSTITASIGVLGGKIVTTGMWDKLGINWQPHQRGDMAGMLSTASAFTPQERAKMRHYLDSTYRIFKGHVESSREGKLTKPIDQMAGGRVYTGRQALELGLVDKLGGLEDSIKYAADQAGIGDYDIRVIPEPPTIFDIFAQRSDKDTISMATGGTFSLLDQPMIRAALPMLAKTDPLRFEALLHALQRIELIHDEGVVMMMPEDLVIR